MALTQDDLDLAQQIASSSTIAPGGDFVPRGLRNRNPGNIVKTNSLWDGEIDGSDSRFKTFETDDAGLDAIGANLLAYNDKHGLNTVSGIINRWAPPTENDTGAYVQSVAASLGVKPDQPIDIRKPEVMTQLSDAIVRKENGKNPYSREQMIESAMRTIRGRTEAAKIKATTPDKTEAKILSQSALSGDDDKITQDDIDAIANSMGVSRGKAVQMMFGGGQPDIDSTPALTARQARIAGAERDQLNSERGLFGDTLKTIGSGATGAIGSIADIGYALTGLGALKGASDGIAKVTDELNKSMSPRMQEAMQKKFFADEGEESTAWTDPLAYWGAVFNGVGSMAPMIPLGAAGGAAVKLVTGASAYAPAVAAASKAAQLAQKGAIASGAPSDIALLLAKSEGAKAFESELAKAGLKSIGLDVATGKLSLASTIGYTAAGTVMTAGDAANNAMDEVRKYPVETFFANSPEFRESVDRMIAAGVPRDKAIEDSKEAVVRMAGREAGGLASIVALPANIIGGKVLHNLFSGGMGSTSRLGNFARAAGAEVPTESFEEGFTQYAANRAVANNIDPNKNVMSGVYDNAFKGGLGAVGMAAPHAIPTPRQANSPLLNAANAGGQNAQGMPQAPTGTPPGAAGQAGVQVPGGESATGANWSGYEVTPTVYGRPDLDARLAEAGKILGADFKTENDLVAKLAAMGSTITTPAQLREVWAGLTQPGVTANPKIVEDFLALLNIPNFTMPGEQPAAPGSALVPAGGTGVGPARGPNGGPVFEGEATNIAGELPGAPRQLPAPPVHGLPSPDQLAAKRDADANYEQAFQDLVKADALGISDAELLAKQQAMRDAEDRLHEINVAIDGNRVAATESARRAILSQVLANPESKNPAAEFKAAMIRAGRNDYRTLTDAEKVRIERFTQLRDTFTAPEVEPSAPNEMDAAAMGIRERGVPPGIAKARAIKAQKESGATSGKSNKPVENAEVPAASNPVRGDVVPGGATLASGDGGVRPASGNDPAAAQSEQGGGTPVPAGVPGAGGQAVAQDPSIRAYQTNPDAKYSVQQQDNGRWRAISRKNLNPVSQGYPTEAEAWQWAMGEEGYAENVKSRIDRINASNDAAEVDRIAKEIEYPDNRHFEGETSVERAASERKRKIEMEDSKRATEQKLAEQEKLVSDYEAGKRDNGAEAAIASALREAESTASMGADTFSEGQRWRDNSTEVQRLRKLQERIKAAPAPRKKGIHETTKEEDAAAEPRFGSGAVETLSSAEKELRALSTPTKQADDDVRLGNLRFVPMAEAMRIVREAIAAGVKAVPFQIHAKTDIIIGDAARVIERLQKLDSANKPKDDSDIDDMLAEVVAEEDGRPAQSADDERKAKAKAQLAEGIDELVSLLGGKKNLLPEEENRILPVMSKIFRAAAELGYLKFKDAARYVMGEIRGVSNEVADKIEIKNLQAAFINLNGMDNLAEVTEFKSIEALMKATPIDAAAHEAATSPHSPTPQPTEAQIEAGNYKKGHVSVQGMGISIENPQGSVRSGVDPDGNEWRQALNSHYGYFTGTKAADGDHVDVFLSDGAEAATVAWVVDQKNRDGSYDEAKVVLGPETEREARKAYLDNYEQGWPGLGAITPMPIEEFKAWLGSSKTKKPVAYVEVPSAKDGLFAQTDLEANFARLKSKTLRFASGMSAIGDLTAGTYARSGHTLNGIGVDIGQLSKNGRKAVTHAALSWNTPIFIDSGAFSAFRSTLKGNEKSLNFDSIMGMYEEILDAIHVANDVEDTDYPRPMLVMPDVVGSQNESINLAKKYAQDIKLYASTNVAQPIVPIQKGALTLAEAYRKITSIVGTDNFIVGLPSNAQAITPDELRAFLGEIKPARVHFLGAASDRKLDPLLRIVAAASPDTKVSADASQIRSKILNNVSAGMTRGDAIASALQEFTDPGVADYFNEQSAAGEPEKVATAPEHAHNEGKPLDKSTIYRPTADGVPVTSNDGALTPGILPMNIDEEGFKEVTDEWADLFADPGAKVRLSEKSKAEGMLSIDEAKDRIEEWKARAKAQFDNPKTRSENGQKTVLSLFDLSGEWSKPWREAGYNVITMDIQTGQDVHAFSAQYFVDNYDLSDVYAILAATPCTDFASSGARWFSAKDADGRTEASKELVFQTMRTIEYFRPAIWALENPVGRIERLTGLPKARLTFDPNDLGDPYTKKTMIWGRFNAELPVAPVEPTEGSKMHSQYGGKSQATKNARSVTPEGFAYAFFMANNYADMPAEQKLANQYPKVSGAIKEALKAGVPEERIHELMDDTYGNYEYDEARDALAEEVGSLAGEIEAAAAEPEAAPAPAPEVAKPVQESMFAEEAPTDSKAPAQPVTMSIDDVPPARIKKAMVQVQRIVGDKVESVSVSAKEALDDLNEEIHAYELLLKCVKG